MRKPQVLLIDDQCGSDAKIRANYCERWGLEDVTGDKYQAESALNSIAQVVVCGGQRRSDGQVINSLAACTEAIEAGREDWALILLDLRFISGAIGPDGKPIGDLGDDEFGLRVLERLDEAFPELPVFVLSASPRERHLIDVLNKGAKEFLAPTEGGTDQRGDLARLLAMYGLLEDNQLRREIFEKQSRPRIIGKSIVIRECLREARRAAESSRLRMKIQRLPCTLILGESGTGKELIARYIHEASERSGRFRAENCKAIPDTLRESTFFGTKKGFATDVAKNKGLFEQADRGTLFLDEMGDLDKDLQGKLLRVLDDGLVTPIGDETSRQVDVHVVFATNQPLEELKRHLEFDFWHRINRKQIRTPALYERRQDIPELAKELISRLSGYRAQTPSLTPEALKKLVNHEWPGNVRELYNVLDKALTDNPSPEFLVPRFLQLELSTQPKVEGPVTTQKPVTREDLRGGLYDVERQCLELVCHYLEKCLEKTRKSDGQINITAAAKLMLGGEELKTAQAAGLIKRVLRAPKQVVDPLLGDFRAVAEALEEARRSRKGGYPKR